MKKLALLICLMFALPVFADPNTGLSHLWKFDTNSADVNFTDYVGDANLTVSAASTSVVYIPGIAGYGAMKGNVGATYYQAVWTGSIVTHTSYLVWFKITPPGWGGYLFKGLPNERTVLVYDGTDITFRVGGLNGHVGIQAPITGLEDGGWHMLAIVLDTATSSNSLVSVDGSALTPVAGITGSLPSADTNFVVLPAGEEVSDVNIGQMAFWGDVNISGDIAELYNSGTGIPLLPTGGATTYYTLTYTAGANGSITGSNPQIVAEGANGTAVTAVPDSGYAFQYWSDGNTANPRTDYSIAADLTVEAVFVGDGGCSLTIYDKIGSAEPALRGAWVGTTCPFRFNLFAGTGTVEVNIWTGTAVDANLVDNPDSNSTFVTVTGDVNVIANYAEGANPCYLLAGGDANGILTEPNLDGKLIGGTTRGLFGCTCGDTFNITYEPNNGFAFNLWQGKTSAITDINDASTTIEVNHPWWVIAFATTDTNSYTLTMADDGNGSTVPTTGGHTYDYNAVVEINAIPDSAAHTFTRWFGSGTGKIVITSSDADPNVAGVYECNGLYGGSAFWGYPEFFTRTDGAYNIWFDTANSAWYISAVLGTTGDNYFYSYEAENPAMVYTLLSNFSNYGGAASGTITSVYSCCAIADANATFTTITMTTDLTAKAYFEDCTGTLLVYVQYDDATPILAADFAGVTCGSSQEYDVNLIEGDYVFSGWTSTGSGAIDDATTTNINVTVTGDCTVTVHYELSAFGKLMRVLRLLRIGE